VLPSVVLTFLSFIAFFMDPDTGERLGSGSRHPIAPCPPPHSALRCCGAEGRSR
jgi:hypothetical protein